MSFEKLGYLPPESKKNYYLTDGEIPLQPKQESDSSPVITAEQETLESGENSENFVTEKIDQKTSELLLKIFARNSTEDTTVPDGFKTFLRQYANDYFLKNYLQEDSSTTNPAQKLPQLEPYRARKNYREYIDDPFFLFLLYNRFYNNLHYDWQQKDKEQQIGQTQSIEKVLQTLGKALFDTRDRYESYVSSHVDAHTGLLNRNTFEDYFTYLQNPAVQEKEKRHELYGFAFVMIDLDHFKNINDTYGHVVGDQVLKKLSEAFLTAAIRKDDAFFRYAGDEFSLIMPLTHDSQIKEIDSALKQRIFQKIAEILRPIAQKMKGLSLPNQPTLDLTLSAGVYILPLSELQKNDQGENLREKIERIVAQADHALYQAKTKRDSLAIKADTNLETTVQKPALAERINQFFQRRKDQKRNKNYTIIPLT